jgi:hypothetical protein
MRLTERNDGSTYQRFDELLIVDLGPDAFRRRRADLFGRDGVGRLEDRQAGPVLDGARLGRKAAPEEP